MRNIFEDEFSVSELKKGLKKMKKKDCNDTLIAVMAAVGIMVIVGSVIFAIVKLSNRDHDDDEYYDEGFSDEDGMYYADEDDFE